MNPVELNEKIPSIKIKNNKKLYYTNVKERYILREKIKRLLGIVLVGLMAVGAIPFNASAATEEYEAYNIKNEIAHVLNMKKIDDDSKTYVAYCYNGLYAPPRMVVKNDAGAKSGSTKYNKILATADNLVEKAVQVLNDGKYDGRQTVFRPRISDGAKLKQVLVDILYNGYPSNASGLMDGLTKDEAYDVTQAAVWYYSSANYYREHNTVTGSAPSLYNRDKDIVGGEYREKNPAKKRMMWEALANLIQVPIEDRVSKIGSDITKEQIKPLKSGRATDISLFEPMEKVSGNGGSYQNLITATFATYEDTTFPAYIVVNKAWEGAALEDGESYPEVYFQLMKNGKPEGKKIKYENKDVIFHIADDKELGLYTIKEVNADGSDWSAEGYKAEGFTIAENGVLIFVNTKKAKPVKEENAELEAPAAVKPDEPIKDKEPSTASAPDTPGATIGTDRSAPDKPVEPAVETETPKEPIVTTPSTNTEVDKKQPDVPTVVEPKKEEPSQSEKKDTEKTCVFVPTNPTVPNVPESNKIVEIDKPVMDEPVKSENPIIEDMDVPKSYAPETPDVDKPKEEDKNVPKTGDDFDSTLYLGMMTMAGGALLLMKKRVKAINK